MNTHFALSTETLTIETQNLTLASILWNYSYEFSTSSPKNTVNNGSHPLLTLSLLSTGNDLSWSVAAALHNQVNLLKALRQCCVLDPPTSTPEWALPELSKVITSLSDSVSQQMLLVGRACPQVDTFFLLTRPFSYSYKQPPHFFNIVTFFKCIV